MFRRNGGKRLCPLTCTHARDEKTLQLIALLTDNVPRIDKLVVAPLINSYMAQSETILPTIYTTTVQLQPL